MHHPEYSQFDNPSSNPLSYDYPPKQFSLEDFLKELQAQTSQTLKEFMQLTSQSTSPISQEFSLEDALNIFRQTVNQPTQELKDATLANTKAIARLEG